MDKEENKVYSEKWHWELYITEYKWNYSVYWENSKTNQINFLWVFGNSLERARWVIIGFKTWMER